MKRNGNKRVLTHRITRDDAGARAVALNGGNLYVVLRAKFVIVAIEEAICEVEATRVSKMRILKSTARHRLGSRKNCARSTITIPVLK